MKFHWSLLLALSVRLFNITLVIGTHRSMPPRVTGFLYSIINFALPERKTDLKAHVGCVERTRRFAALCVFSRAAAADGGSEE